MPHLKNSVSGNVSVGLNTGFSLKVAGVNVGAQINAGSAQVGSDGFKVTSGVAVNTGIVGIEVYDNAYKLDTSHDVKERDFKLVFLCGQKIIKLLLRLTPLKKNIKK